jgi:hypothetical protein
VVDNIFAIKEYTDKRNSYNFTVKITKPMGSRISLKLGPTNRKFTTVKKFPYVEQIQPPIIIPQK